MKHGTLSCYTNDGCRCDECSAAGRKYATEYRARAKARRARPPREVLFPKLHESRINRGLRDGELAVTCWCEDRLVIVPKDDLLVGITGSCGDPDCKPALSTRSPQPV